MTSNDKGRKHEGNPAQPWIDTSLKALYAAAGMTDLIAERFKEYAEARQEEARQRRAKALEQFNQATEKAQEMMHQAPSKARALPDQVQEQLEELLRELNLSFEDMVRRGEQRLAQFRHGAAEAARDGAETVEKAADQVDPEVQEAEIVDEPVTQASEDVVEAVEATEATEQAEEKMKPAPKPAKKAPAKKAPAKKAPGGTGS